MYVCEYNVRIEQTQNTKDVFSMHGYKDSTGVAQKYTHIAVSRSCACIVMGEEGLIKYHIEGDV